MRADCEEFRRDLAAAANLNIIFSFAMQSLTGIEEDRILHFDFKFSWRKPINKIGKFGTSYISLSKAA